MTNSDTKLNDQTTTVDEIIDLRHYFNVINKYKWQVIMMATMVAILAAVITLNMTPIYRATASLLIEAEQAKAVSFEEIVGLDSNRKEYYLTQFEILKSREIAQSVIEKLQLKDHLDFIHQESLLDSLKKSLPFMPQKDNSSLTQEERDEFALESLIDTFADRLTISPIRKTQLVNISYESSDSKMAALVANTVGETYIEQNLNAKMGLNKKASGWLNNRLTDLQARLNESEEKLQLYREQENLIDIEGVLSLVAKELEQTSQQLVVARNDSNKLDSIMRVVNEYGRENIEMLSSMSEVTSHRVIEDVKKSQVQVERKVSELAEVFGPLHPKMIAARAELAAVQKNLTTQVRRLVTGIEKNLNTTKRNVQAIEKELVRIRAQYQDVNRKSNEYHQLKREVETNRHIYDTFLSRSKETDVTSDFTSEVARFTDRAFRPSEPVKPKKTLIVALAFIVTLGLGVVLAFIHDTLNDTFKSAGDIENKLALRLLGVLPRVEMHKDVDILTHLFFDKDAKKFAESVRTLRTSFALTQVDKKSKIIEVVSSVPGEGKSTTAINLAFSLGQMDKTILIDADMRKPSISKRFDMPAYHPGLSNLINGSEKIQVCMFRDRKSALTVMPSGQIPANPLEILASQRFAKVIEQLKEHFAHIIIDTPPINAVSDSLVIAQHADAVIYVVKSDSTRVGVVQNGIRRLIETNANIAGVVLNQVDTKKISQSEYYHGYYDTYSYGDGADTASDSNSKVNKEETS